MSTQSNFPYFQRSPRTFPTLPTQELEIQSPPPIPTRPASSLIVVLLPLGFTVLGLGLSIVFLASNSAFLLLSVPLMLGSGLVGVINYYSERKKYTQAVEQRERGYHIYLSDNRKTLEEYAIQQRRANLEIHPDYNICLAIAQRKYSDITGHLWERSSGLERPRDADFLHIRLGTGRLPATFKVKPPSSRPQVGDSDELYEQAVRLAQEFQFTDGVAVSLPLAQVGSAGMAGPRSHVLENSRALLVHLAALHAPNEVKIVALLPAHELSEWDWLRWLPHVWDDERKNRFIAAAPDQARQLLSTLSASLQKRNLNNARDDKFQSQQTYVFLFADPTLYSSATDTSVIGPLTYLLLSQGANIGAYSLFLHDRPKDLPSACGAVIDLSSGSGRLLRSIGAQTEETSFSPDRVTVAQADQFSRTLAPVRLKQMATQADLPSSVTLLELLKAKTPDEIPIQTFWEVRDSYKSLEAPLGIETGGGIVAINFQEAARGGDGSHAMVGGTIGTGKTRFLQTMITLLAVQHHPHDVNFVLIDYKGGDLLQGLEELPHVVGTLANLEKQDTQAVLTERLFVCLQAELERRNKLVGRQGVNDYQNEFLQGKHPEPLAHLFVVIDEFAELIRNSSDKAATIKRLLSIGSRGRSLGVHLVLATQDPSGVVNDDLRTNINNRLCLRMGSRAASVDILRLPDAFDNITGAQVGRAYLQVGNNDRFVPFQVAWGGDKYTSGIVGGGEIAEVTLDGKRKPLHRFAPIQAVNETQLSALVSHICKTAENLGLQRLGSPLSPPLRETIFLEELRRESPVWDGQTWNSASQSEWVAPLIGQLDDPSNQSQDPLRLPLGKEGHLALFGEPGSGKTTFIQTLVTSLACSHSPSDIHLYVLDFSGQRLLALKGFPHVGDVFLADDLDRIQRFFRFLNRELRERKSKFARLGVSNLYDYRALSKELLPAMLVVLEDYATFNKTCLNRNLDLDDSLAGFVRDGGSYGVHFVLTMASPSELKPRLANSITLAATFHLATPDYGMAVGPTGGMQPAPIPGRGLIKGTPPLEFQTALPVQGFNDIERTLALKSLMDAMDHAWSGQRPGAFDPPPSVLGLSDLVPPADCWSATPPVGFSARFAIPYDDPGRVFEVSLQDGPYFLVAGTPQSGKTTLLQAWILALAERYALEHLVLYIVDFRRSGLFSLSELPQVNTPLKSPKGTRKTQFKNSRYITDEDRFGLALAEISEMMQKRQNALEELRQKTKSSFDIRAWQNSQQSVLLVIDDLEIFQAEVQPGIKDLLEANLKKWRDLGFVLIAAGPINEIENAWGWIAQLRNAPVGFQLGTAALNQVFKLNELPADNLSKHLPTGDAFFIQRNQFQQLKIADPQTGSVPVNEWVESLKNRKGCAA